MKKGSLNARQIIAAFFAAIIFVFSFGVSLAEPAAKNLSPGNEVSLTKSGSSGVAPQESMAHRLGSIVHAQFIAANSVVFAANAPFARYITCEAFFVNSHVRNAIYALPNIHAP